MATNNNPWSQLHFGHPVTVADMSDRMSMVRMSIKPEWLKSVIAERSTQKNVRLAAERRLLRLAK